MLLTELNLETFLAEPCFQHHTVSDVTSTINMDFILLLLSLFYGKGKSLFDFIYLQT